MPAALPKVGAGNQLGLGTRSHRGLAAGGGAGGEIGRTPNECRKKCRHIPHAVVARTPIVSTVVVKEDSSKIHPKTCCIDPKTPPKIRQKRVISSRKCWFGGGSTRCGNSRAPSLKGDGFVRSMLSKWFWEKLVLENSSGLGLGANLGLAPGGGAGGEIIDAFGVSFRF